MKRFLVAVLSTLAAGLALAAPPYDVTATMPSNGGSFDACRLYVDGAAVGEDRPCDSAQVFTGLLAADGTYSFTYTVILDDDNGSEPGGSEHETAQSPAYVVDVSELVLPTDPDAAPQIQIDCAPCIVTPQ